MAVGAEGDVARQAIVAEHIPDVRPGVGQAGHDFVVEAAVTHQANVGIDSLAQRETRIGGGRGMGACSRGSLP